MTSVELNQLLIKSYPELKSEYEEEVSWQEGDETGSHVVFGDVFTPYLEKILNDKDNEKVRKAFGFIEQVLDLNDKYCDEVIAFSVLEGLFDDSANFEFATPYMGKRTQKFCEELKQSLSR